MSDSPIRYSKDGHPDRLVYTPADKVNAEWDGFAPSKPADEKAADKLEASTVESGGKSK